MSYKVYNNYSEQDKESIVIAKLGEVEDAIKDLTSIASGRTTDGKINLYSDNDQIYKDEACTDLADYAYIKSLVDVPMNMVYINNSNYSLEYQYTTYRMEEGERVDCIWFNGVTDLGGKAYVYCIKINSKDQVEVEEHELAEGGTYTHNVAVNHTTANGTWDYVFNVNTRKATQYGQLAEIANDIHRLTPGIALPASGTYTEGNNVYVVTKVKDFDTNMVQVEMRKLSDGSLRVISTGIIDVVDTIISRL